VNALMKTCKNEKSSRLILNTSSPNILDSILSLPAASPTQKGLVSIILCRLLDHISSELDPQTSLTLKAVLVPYLDSSDPLKKSTGLQGLSSLFEAKAIYGIEILKSDGLLDSLLEDLEFVPESVQLHTIELISTCCSDQECRKLVSSNESCVKYLKSVVSSTSVSKPSLKLSASLALVKTLDPSTSSSSTRSSQDEQLANTFMSALKSFKTSNASIQEMEMAEKAVESLAYLSHKGPVKEKLISDSQLISKLVQLLQVPDSTPSTTTKSAIVSQLNTKALQFGIVVIMYNLTVIPTPLTDEELQLLKLKSMAGEATLQHASQDPTNSKEKVEARAVKLISLGVVSGLNKCLTSHTSATNGQHSSTSSSSGVLEKAAGTFCNMAVFPATRGRLVQQGAVASLLGVLTRSLAAVKNEKDETYMLASHAIAKMMISIDPSNGMTHLFPLYYHPFEFTLN
jgi:protein unc-45